KPRSENIYSIGVLAKILKVIPVSEDSLSVLVTVIGQAEVENVYELEEPEIMYVDVAQIKEKFPTKTQEEEMDVLLTSIVSLYRKILSLVGDDETEGVVKSMENIDNPLILMHFIIMNSPLDSTEKQELLECRSIRDRAKKLLGFLDKAKQFMKIRAEIAKTTQERLTQQQKEHFLRQQIATIEDELGEGPEDDEINELISKSEKKVWGEKVQAHFDKEVRKLERFPPNSPEYGIQYNYLENMLNLPWDQYSEDNFDLKKVRERLDADHYGLEKVKERIVEQMAVLKLRGDMKAPILCFYGPPGVGKTSLGRSIAAAIGREYERVALGGLHDEAEIRGHRRTYIGAMPGRILAALEKVGSGNPVLVLDEVDKISRDMKGDPSTALLEVLDPEQNNKFHDNYLNYDYDLSKVMFIATANDLSTISAPLLDRMELIEVPGYVTDEKLEIATRHLVPKVTMEHGLPEGAFEVSREALTYIIDRYTR
ncbi:MAG: AAA family ATPase, partial [Muribaculaceae bacterium]|nr:AAA family ATPase [Muribaculaceae bacterium]